MNPDDYDFYSEDQKQTFIQDTSLTICRCPNCGEGIYRRDGALELLS